MLTFLYFSDNIRLRSLSIKDNIFGSQKMPTNKNEPVSYDLAVEEEVATFKRLLGHHADSPRFTRTSVPKELKVGRTLFPGVLMHMLNAYGCEITENAQDLLYRMPLLPVRKTVMLEFVSADNLGLNAVNVTQEVFDAGDARSLCLCPPEAGPVLISYYFDQPVGGMVGIAMEPIESSDGTPRLFTVERLSDGRRLLNAHYAPCVARWYPTILWVFAKGG